ncbi:hypothetical protein [Aurantibacillus circumpalustris]|uniref:hypothetical protein n=1 Tax=Aurantibacillus circumpalustris TaxID=3036359 RepID=UPI00295A72C6|nr:hypothetical protein [Aurantibacillus circumpalustris]
MSVMNKLASSLGRRDEVPNQELANKIIASKNSQSVKELIENLNNKNKNIQNDCIKVLYEIGSKEPMLIADFSEVFVNLLNHKNNRLQWGAMTALNTITEIKPEKIHASLSKIILAADRGSVITNDQCVAILIKLCGKKKFENSAFTLLIERLIKCPTNQLPMYAENALKIIAKKKETIFISTITKRIPEIEKESKRKRIEKVIKKALKS